MIVLIRHGETEWSRDLRHTGRTDVALTAKGREQALLAGRRFAGRRWKLVLTSPLQRAHETARLAGLDGQAEPDRDLVEWDYGRYEGRTTEDIREQHPGWDVWRDGPDGGETVDAVGDRADRVIERALAADGDVAIFGHGHLLRILAARWIGLPAAGGGALKVDTAAVSELGFERERRVICLWNGTGHLRSGAA
ncbi:MAG: histidine phosphatase family protein [Solirubrobacteraceae bacterium]